MKALVFRGVREMEVEDVPIPTISDNEVLVKVDSCAICGTDIRTFNYGHPKIKEARILGHEFSGIVAEIGKNVSGFTIGGKVMVVPGIPCGKCYFCQHGLQNLCDYRKIIGFDFDGGFAEYVKIPSIAVEAGNIKLLPSNLSLKEVALIEPFTAVYNGQNQLDIRIGTTVAIIGAGPIGLMHALQARFRGASKIALFDISEERVGLASGFDVDFVINSKREDIVQKSLELTNGRGFDVVIVSCVSSSAQAQALQIARKGGKVLYFAGLPHGKSVIELDTNLIHYKQLTVFGSNGSGSNQYEDTINFLATGKINLSKLITTELSIKDALKGFELAQTSSALKIVIHP